MSIMDSQQWNVYYNKVYQQLLFSNGIEDQMWENEKYEDEKYTLICGEIMNHTLGAS
jgi:hypothetical protein